MSTQMSRAEIIRHLMDAGRAASTATVFYHQALAAKFGLTATDWKCADIIGRFGPMTAGELAAHTQLTTGAITGVLDHLEKARLAKRQLDPKDRRKTIIALLPDREAEIVAILQPLMNAFSQLAEKYSDEELAIIDSWITQAIEISQEAAKDLANSDA